MTALLTTLELVLAQDLARQAGEIMLRYAHSDQQEVTKGDDTPVTIADTTINTLVIEGIARKFPGDVVIGEEESTGSYGKGRRWICDPIDGTLAYTIDLSSAMFSLAFVVDGVPEVAVTFEPHTKRLYSAIRGQGSYCNGKRLQVSEDTMETARLALPPDYIMPKLIDLPFMKKLLAYNKQLAIFPGAVFRSCKVADGRIAGFPHPNVKPYDIAAAHLIVEEAGGKVTNIHGQPLDYSQDFRGAVVSNGVVHDDLTALFNDN